MNSGTLVCFAVKQEASAFRGMAAAHPQVEILLTGMGKPSAERTIRAALAKRLPDKVISAGFAGGLVPELPRRTVVYSVEGDASLEHALRAAGARPARFHCSETVLATAQQKQALNGATGAEVVEMESEIIRRVCREHGISSATVRVILDTAGEDLVLDFNQIMTTDRERIHFGKLALALFQSPTRIAGLIRLQQQSAAAARTLAEVLSRTLFGGA